MERLPDMHGTAGQRIRWPAVLVPTARCTKTLRAGITKTPLRIHRAHGQAAIRKLLAAVAVSSFGDGLMAVALPLLALRLTSNPLLIGGLAAATSLPWVVVGLPAGVLVDRVDRRRLVLVVDTARALVVGVVAGLAALGRATLVDLYVAAVLVGVGETIVHAASRSVVPRSASGDDMVRANGRVTAAQTVTLQFGGPALGGVLFGMVRALPFLGDAVSYLGSAVLLRAAVADADRTRTSALLLLREPRRASARSDLRAGLRWFAGSALLRVLVATVSSFAFCQAAVLGVLVVYAGKVLHLTAAGYGVFLALAAIGDVLGSLAAARIHATLRPYATVVAAGLAAAGGYLILGSTTSRVVAVAGLALEAAATSIGNVAVTSARYRAVPAERFGIVSNAFRMFVTGAIPLGSIAGGALAAALGTQPTFLLAGALQLSTLLALAIPLRSLAATAISPASAPLAARDGAADVAAAPDTAT